MQVKEIKRSRDNQRVFISSFNAIRKEYKYHRRAIEDIFSKSGSAKQARDICALLAFNCKLGKAQYSFNLPDGEAILSHLKERKGHVSPLLSLLSREAIDRFETVATKNINDPYLSAYNPLLVLSGIYDNGYPQGLPLLARFFESLLLNNFQEYRYRSPEAEAQLEFFQGDPSV